MLVNLNSQYEKAGASSYKIDSIYSPNDQVELNKSQNNKTVLTKDRANSSNSYLSTKECSDQRMTEENNRTF